MKRDWRQAKLAPQQHALCAFAEKLTRAPAEMRPADLNALRVAGLRDRDILDAVQIISYFNYINRVADALGVDPEFEMQPALERWRATKVDS